LAAFGKVIGSKDKIAFEALVKSATEMICPRDAPGRFAARDRLRVDCWGPEKGHLSFVDLPGLIQLSNKDQSDEDKRVINEIANEYMKSRRTIILAIVGGNNDYVHQTVLEKARHFDPDGARTIGVVTKPDLTASIGLEDKFINLLNNGDIKLQLGWQAVLNQGPGEAWSSVERKQKENEFFSREKWDTLPPHICGADNLWKKVSVELYHHIARYVPVLLKELEQELKKCEAELASLGSGKDTVEEMKAELAGYFSTSRQLIDRAIQGHYRNPKQAPKFFPLSPDKKGTPIRNLRACVVEENSRFAEKIEKQGHKVNIVSEEDVHGLVNGFRSGHMTKRDYIKKMVEPTLKQNIGMEQSLDSNPLLIYKLFQSCSENWDEFAKAHKRTLALICKKFLEEVVSTVWPERMRKPLWNLLLNQEMENAHVGADKEVELLAGDRQLLVRSYDPEYVRRVRQWQKEQSENSRKYSPEEEYLEKTLIFYDVCGSPLLLVR
jgi:hypothetical protein